MSDELDSVQHTVMMLSARCVALETLCLALFRTVPDQAKVLELFKGEFEQFTAGILNADWIKDAPIAAFQDEHERILKVLSAGLPPREGG